VLDGSAAQPHDRGIAVLSAVALPFVLLGTAVRAPLLESGPPPVIGVTAVVGALAIFAVQALVAATAVAPRERLRTAFRRG
jgi:predicted aconitase with swiveling domain